MSGGWWAARCGRCRLEGVQILNRGVDWECGENVYWKHALARWESMRVVLHGDAEFEARDVTIRGEQLFEVPAGHRMRVYSGPHGEWGSGERGHGVRGGEES